MSTISHIASALLKWKNFFIEVCRLFFKTFSTSFKLLFLKTRKDACYYLFAFTRLHCLQNVCGYDWWIRDRVMLNLMTNHRQYTSVSVCQLELISGRQLTTATWIALQDANDKKVGSLIHGGFSLYYSLSIDPDYSFLKITLHSSKFCCCYI